MKKSPAGPVGTQAESMGLPLSKIVVPKLDAWLDDLAGAIPRVIEDTDSEAVHDLRVAMRRIRSLLRVVRPVFGEFYVNRIRGDMKQVAAATGSLRDEEVLSETIAALDLTEEVRSAVGPWLAERTEREKALRTSVIELLSSGALEEPQAHLRALLRLPLLPGRDKDARAFARKVVFKAHEQVEVLRSGEVTNGVAMHELRIAYKRLRYSVEALTPALSPELRAWGQVAVKFQKVLGNLHDQDVAVDIVKTTKVMPVAVRDAVLAALADKRAQYAQQYLEAAGLGVVEPPHTPVATEPEPQPPTLAKPAPRKRAPRKQPAKQPAHRPTTKASPKKAPTKRAPRTPPKTPKA